VEIITDRGIMKIKIVRAKLEDANQIEELDGFGHFRQRVIESYLPPIDQTKIGKYFIFLAKLSGRAVGKVEMVVGPGSEGTIAYIRRLVVHPDYRRKGIAVLLMKKAMVQAKASRPRFIELHALDGDIPAKKLYEKLGFEVKHKEVHYRKSMKRNERLQLANNQFKKRNRAKKLGKGGVR
jgi:ribosomal protein S18 acetylase RimI-like enzyme